MPIQTVWVMGLVQIICVFLAALAYQQISFIVSLLILIFPLTIVLVNYLEHVFPFLLVILIYVDIYTLNGKIIELFPILYYLFYVLKTKKLLPFKLEIKTNSWLLVFVLSCFLSLINTGNEIYTMEKILRLILLIASYYLLINYLMESFIRLGYLINVMLIMGILNSIIIIYQFIFIGNLRNFGLAGLPSVDILVSQSLMFFAMTLVGKLRKERIIGFFCFMISMLSIYCTQTRNSLLSFSLGVFVLFILTLLNSKLKKQIYNSKLFYILLFSFILIVTFVFLSGDPSTNRFSDFGADDKLNSIHTRVMIWDTALTTFLLNPLIGVGFNSFAVNSVNYYTINPLLFNQYVNKLDAHLPYLDLLTGVGIIGTLFFLFWQIKIVKIIKTAIMNKKLEENSQLLGLATVNITIIVSFFYSGAWFYGQNSFQMILFWALLIAYYKHKYEYI